MIITGLPIDSGIFHDLGGATLAPRGLAVPDREQHVRAIDRLDAAVEVAVFPVVVLADDAQMIRSGQRLFHG